MENLIYIFKNPDETNKATEKLIASLNRQSRTSRNTAAVALIFAATAVFYMTKANKYREQTKDLKAKIKHLENELEKSQKRNGDK